jgi:hypothetical protein
VGPPGEAGGRRSVASRLPLGAEPPSSDRIRLPNQDMIDLFTGVRVGANVVLLPHGRRALPGAVIAGC